MSSVIRGDDNFDTTPTVSSNVPAFSAKPSTSQDIPNATWTYVDFGTKLADSNNTFNTSTSKFTPAVAGMYQLSMAIAYGDGTSGTKIRLALYKNGVEGVQAINDYDSTLGYGIVTLSYLVEANTTDYFQIRTYHSRGQACLVISDRTFFTGFKLAGV
tara:strand:+ start:27 stop:500 length:474 start_codon:yes stop_codon:yes gene_type:complete